MGREFRQAWVSWDKVWEPKKKQEFMSMRGSRLGVINKVFHWELWRFVEELKSVQKVEAKYGDGE